MIARKKEGSPFLSASSVPGRQPLPSFDPSCIRQMSSPATLPSASSSKKPKRGRSPSTPYGSTSPSSYYPPKPLATPHPLFRLEDDPDSDIILQSSDHKLLWIPSYYVKAYSSVRPLTQLACPFLPSPLRVADFPKASFFPVRIVCRCSKTSSESLNPPLTRTSSAVCPSSSLRRKRWSWSCC